jgi:hypothetical protein
MWVCPEWWSYRLSQFLVVQLEQAEVCIILRHQMRLLLQ